MDEASQTGLRRELGLFDSTMIGVGIFVLLGIPVYSLRRRFV